MNSTFYFQMNNFKNIACLDKNHQKSHKQVVVLLKLVYLNPDFPPFLVSAFRQGRIETIIKQNFPSIATICKRPHVDKMNGAPVGPFRVRIDK